MPYMNEVKLVGHLGDDPQTSAAGDNKVSRFSIAINRTWKDKDGQQQKATDWFRVSAWRGLSTMASSLKKGDAVFVQGSLRPGEFTDRNNVKRQTIEVVADMIFPIAKAQRGDAYEGAA